MADRDPADHVPPLPDPWAVTSTERPRVDDCGGWIVAVVCALLTLAVWAATS